MSDLKKKRSLQKDPFIRQEVFQLRILKRLFAKLTFSMVQYNMFLHRLVLAVQASQPIIKWKLITVLVVIFHRYLEQSKKKK
jgi:hypothetical protein